MLGVPHFRGYEIRRRRKARAGPEGETSFPYGVNKNSCFLLAPQQAEGFTMGPARAFSLARTCPPKPWRRREARRQFCSKKVRISSNKRTSIKLSGILPIDSAARSAAENGNTGSPRTVRLAKRRFGIPCDFKYLLCPIKN